LLVAKVGEAQEALLVSSQVTISLFASAVVVYVAKDPFCTEPPFTLKLYCGVAPPLVGVAVNVTDVPAQILVLVALNEAAGIKVGFTVIVNDFEAPEHVAVAGVTSIVATIFEPPPLFATNEEIFPVPEAFKPIRGWLFDHE
jgi:hypothetical protein